MRDDYERLNIPRETKKPEATMFYLLVYKIFTHLKYFDIMVCFSLPPPGDGFDDSPSSLIVTLLTCPSSTLIYKTNTTHQFGGFEGLY
jgi:hypothetical protein